MPYPLPVMVHVIAGALAIVAGFWALAVRKGGPGHRRVGTVFFGAMLVMAGMAAVLALANGQRTNALAAGFTLYLVATAWMTVRRPAATVGRFEAFAFAGAAMLALGGWATGALIASGVLAPGVGDFGAGFLVFGALAALGAGLDLKVIRCGGLVGADRLRRHLWRMCLALFVAAGSFFLGQQDEMPRWIVGPHLAVPPLAALGALAWWMWRLRRPSRRRARPQPA